MLSSVLKSERAVKREHCDHARVCEITRTLESNRELARKFEELEQRVGRHDDEIATILEAIRQLMAPPEEPRSGDRLSCAREDGAATGRATIDDRLDDLSHVRRCDPNTLAAAQFVALDRIGHGPGRIRHWLTGDWFIRDDVDLAHFTTIVQRAVGSRAGDELSSRGRWDQPDDGSRDQPHGRQRGAFFLGRRFSCRTSFSSGSCSLSAGSYGVFLSADLFLLFVFYELVIVPKYFLIAILGSTNKEYGAMKLTLYSFFGGALVFVGILIVYVTAGSFDLNQLAQFQFSPQSPSMGVSGSCFSGSPSSPASGHCIPGRRPVTSPRPRPARCCSPAL